MLAIRAGLLLIVVFLGYQSYRVIMEPIEFERIEKRRLGAVKEKLETIREAQKLYEREFNNYTANLDGLIAWIDTGTVDITVRKDSSFEYYNQVYRQDMMKDTVVYRVIGSETVKQNLEFGEDFDPESLRYVPYSDNVEFEMDAGEITKNGVRVPTVIVIARHKDIYHDLIEKGLYDYFIDPTLDLHIGGLYEPTLSGNWK